MLKFLKDIFFIRSRNNFSSIEHKLAWKTFVAGAIPSSVLLILLSRSGISINLFSLLVILLVIVNLFFVLSVWREADYQFRSIHSLLDAVVQGDFSSRGLAPDASGAFGELVETINSLAATLQRQRFKSAESMILVKKIVDHIDVAIIAFDQHNLLHLVNPEAETLLGLSTTQQNQLVPSNLLDVEIPIGETRVVSLHLQTGLGRFRLHREKFISEGEVHNLLFITDLSTILRLEERRAWKNLLRVLSHEINNSVTPISSYSSALIKQVNARVTDTAIRSELVDGLTVIRNRARSMAEFVESYNDKSRLPDPDLQYVEISDLIYRIAQLFPQEEIHICGVQKIILADPKQMEQALLNILKNSIEANRSRAETPELGEDVKLGVSIVWSESPAGLEIQIIDSGDGILNSDNLFTPFYTTKSGGSGIGLILSQQIIEAHNGRIALSNRNDRPGCLVTIILPTLRSLSTLM